MLYYWLSKSIRVQRAGKKICNIIQKRSSSSPKESREMAEVLVLRNGDHHTDEMLSFCCRRGTTSSRNLETVGQYSNCEYVSSGGIENFIIDENKESQEKVDKRTMTAIGKGLKDIVLWLYQFFLVILLPECRPEPLFDSVLLWPRFGNFP